jgi:putative FmdB family regulatory protein
MPEISRRENFMPIYEYACASCGRIFEKIQRVPEGEFSCPSCGARAERTVSLTSAGASSGGGSTAAGCGSGGFT